jgi:TRAP-type uncharacterized transport system fused permease subunit
VAVKLGIVAFIIPYFFVLNPALVGRSDVLSVIIYTSSAFFGTILLAYGFFGRIKSNLNLVFRVLYLGSGFLLMCPNHILSIIGVSVVIPVFLCQRLIINKLKIVEEKP